MSAFPFFTFLFSPFTFLPSLFIVNFTLHFSLFSLHSSLFSLHSSLKKDLPQNKMQTLLNFMGPHSDWNKTPLLNLNLNYEKLHLSIIQSLCQKFAFLKNNLHIKRDCKKIYSTTLSFANFRSNVFRPPCSKSTIAFALRGSPSSSINIPNPKRSCSIF